MWGSSFEGFIFGAFLHCARDRDALVADHMLCHNDEVHWDMNFIILVHDWEVDTVSSFLNALYSARSPGDEDKCCWGPSQRRSFESKLFIKFSFPWKNMWRSKAPLWVAFFTWTTSLEKILIMDNLYKQHIIAIDW